MKFVIVPVKDLSKAKERLSSLLPQHERTAIAYAMLEDVLSALKQSTLADRKFIVTLDAKAIEIAQSLGIEVILETEQNGESASVDYASQIAKDMGATSVLVIPGDAPLITTEDIDFLLEREKGAPSIIFVPARDELGTNAILRKPPDAIPSMFGHDSYNKHMSFDIKDSSNTLISPIYYNTLIIYLPLNMVLNHCPPSSFDTLLYTGTNAPYKNTAATLYI